MGPNLLTQNPFAVLTFIAAPAILTNATSVLAMSTINRMLRTRDRMHQLFKESESPARANDGEFRKQVERTEKQAVLLLRAVRWVYVALGAFAAASFVTLLGALAGNWVAIMLERIIIALALMLGFVGVGGLVSGSVNLFRATRLSLENIRDEAALIRLRRTAAEST